MCLENGTGRRRVWVEKLRESFFRSNISLDVHLSRRGGLTSWRLEWRCVRVTGEREGVYTPRTRSGVGDERYETGVYKWVCPLPQRRVLGRSRVECVVVTVIPGERSSIVGGDLYRIGDMTKQKDLL